jgi:hypothetical protein
MNWIISNIEWVLIVCGALTTTMLLPMIAPRFEELTQYLKFEFDSLC